ncbi:hypothetical protein FJU30_13440 [Affinibrenneria salicis]|uniref:Acyl carrier protein n=1 Tax=Affinibrenneria salicis TaxID=2590031 RepID=A0A5J5FYP1_9GAMM|nr:hypothetical protein [Affinibrenneria salicis]KAA8999338.1 hypothetical protein FJU30_13440 [Affinibrenneria salicis]
MSPSLSDVIDFTRKFTADYRSRIDEHTYLEADLGVTGDDGVEFLEAIEQAFGIALHTKEEGYTATFDLKENEYLFESEGLDLLGLCRLAGWLRNIPTPVIRDLSIGQLHNALTVAYQKQAGVEKRINITKTEK